MFAPLTYDLAFLQAYYVYIVLSTGLRGYAESKLINYLIPSPDISVKRSLKVSGLKPGWVIKVGYSTSSQPPSRFSPFSGQAL
ncbi:hypothetical protein [Algoriphagus resistens]|uniref:hypothetical protein n=1 Tax=Algoriphagus resistens TaxID=1750590 RepID=UPI0007168CE0|nr:hypothetical protein [Algoriphagus resistens]